MDDPELRRFLEAASNLRKQDSARNMSSFGMSGLPLAQLTDAVRAECGIQGSVRAIFATAERYSGDASVGLLVADRIVADEMKRTIDLREIVVNETAAHPKRFDQSIKEVASELNSGIRTRYDESGRPEHVRDWSRVLKQLVDRPTAEVDAELGRLPTDLRDRFVQTVVESAARLRGDKVPDLASETIAPVSPQENSDAKSNEQPPETVLAPDKALAEVLSFDLSIAEDRKRIMKSFQALLGRLGCVLVNSEVERNLELNAELAEQMTRRLNDNGLKVHVNESEVVGTIRFSTGGGAGDTWRFVVHGKKPDGKASSTTFDNDFRRLMVQ